MNHVLKNEQELRRLAADGDPRPATTGHKAVLDDLWQIERDCEAGRISAATAGRRLDEAAVKVAKFREVAQLRGERESVDELTGVLCRVMHQVGDPLAALAEGKITAAEARRRGVDVR